MKRCPTCQRSFDDGVAFCREHGVALVPTEVRTVADLLGVRHPASEVRALIAAAARAVAAVSPERFDGVVLPEDLELAGTSRVLVAVDLDARRRDDPGARIAVAQHRAPEPRAREGATEPALVYGLGSIAYALLAGTAPFEGHSAAAVEIRKRLEGPARVATDDDALSELLARAMRVEPERRPTLAELVEALQAAAPQAPAVQASAPQAVAAPAMAAPAMAAPAMAAPAMAAPAMAAPAKPRRGGWWGVVASLAVLGSVVAVMTMGRPMRSSEVAPSAPTPTSSPTTQSVPVPTPTPTATAPIPPPEPMTAPSRARSTRGHAATRGPLGGVGETPGLSPGAPEPAAPEGDSPPRDELRESTGGIVGPPQPAPRASSAPPPARSDRDLAGWALVGAGALLAVAVAATVLRRRRVVAPPPPPTRIPEVESGDFGVAAFAHTVPDARLQSAPRVARRCPSCAQEVPGDARFCPFDGASVGGPVTAAPSPPRVAAQAFRVGPYLCTEALGEGAMGVVYRARHVHLDRPAAVKVLLPGTGLDPARLALFRREARLAASVQHPNTVGIYDFDELDGGLLYLAMELVEGRTLDAIVAEGPVAPTVARAIVAQLGEGLDAAHRAGVVHRDLKPANVMVSQGPAPRVKIVDFGVARAVFDARSTESGRVMGTLPYMPPEQARGEDSLDARADVFALAVVSYEMLTGALPFDDHTHSFHAALVRRAMLAAPPPSVRTRSPSLPPALDHCLRRGMHPEREERTASAGLFARELAAALDGADAVALTGS